MSAVGRKFAGYVRGRGGGTFPRDVNGYMPAYINDINHLKYIIGTSMWVDINKYVVSL